ncbi:MAG: carboxypeptidase regulatory-like domain-containing protein [Acidobacteriota bacterium]
MIHTSLSNTAPASSSTPPAGSARPWMMPLLVVGLVLLGAGTGSAQYNTAEISGVVRDELGGVLAGVNVAATNAATGLKIERVSDGGGRFFLAALPVGEYTLTVQHAGFKPFTEKGLLIQVGQKIDLPVTLQIGSLTDTITVVVGARLLRTANAEIAEVIDNRQIQQLPLNGRQFIQLAQLTDGVTIPPGGTRGAALGQVGPLPNVYGQRGGHNIYLIDGVKVTDELFNNLVINPSVDAIQEFKIQKTMYPAEFGGKASALINVVSRSGGNGFHGSGLGFVRNQAFDSRNYFADPTQPNPPLRQHQFGINVGGPVRRDRTFFFVSYEGQRIRKAQTQVFSVPTAALRAGDFSGAAPLCDPSTRTTTGTCTPFTGNQIPSNRMSPVASALLARVPLPTSAGLVQNLLGVEDQVNPMNQFSLKIDQRIGTGETLFGRFTALRVDDTQPFGTSSLNEALVPGFGRTVTTRSENVGLGYTRPFGTRWLNEVRFGYLAARGGQVSPNQGVDFGAAAGLQGVTQDERDMGYPQVSFGGLFSAIGDPTSFVSRNNRSYELYDNVMLDRGNHHLKFGGYLFHLRFNPVNPTNARGNFTFTGQWSGNAFADFLLGYPSSSQVGIGRADEHGRSTWLHVYGQDDWKVRSNLTVNYGLRYEINSEMTDVDNRLSAVDLPNRRFVIASDDNGTLSPDASPLLSRIPIPYTTSKDAGWQRGLLRPSYRRLAPRLGVVWSPGGSGKTVINAGFGVFLNQWAYSVQQALASTLPFFFAKTVTAAADALQPTLNTSTVLLAPSNGTVGGSTMDWDFRTEYAKNYSVSVQREVTPTTMLEVSFLRSAIVGADSSTVRNVPEPGPGAIGPRRPVPQLANITAIRWDGYSIFNGVTVRAQQRLSRGLAMTAFYTLSKAIDDASDPGGTAFEANLPQDVHNMAAEEAPASFDHRHRVVGSLTYALPAVRGRGVASALLSDWQVNGILLLESGAPFTVNLGTDRANIGAGPAQRPDQTCDPNQGGARTAQQWFNTGCFALQPQFTFGNAPRNSVLAPGYASVDVGFLKDVALSNSTRLQFRWEIFNLLNRTNFDVPNRVALTPNFGRISSTKPPRQMQFGVKLLF